MVRIRFPPAESQSLSQSCFRGSRTPAFRAAVRGHLVVRDDVERLRLAGAPRLEGWLLERALDLVDQAPELLDQAQAALLRRSREEYEDFCRREANGVAERAAHCIDEGDCATAIALCLEVGSALSRFARTDPAEPAPTTI